MGEVAVELFRSGHIVAMNSDSAARFRIEPVELVTVESIVAESITERDSSCRCIAAVFNA